MYVLASKKGAHHISTKSTFDTLSMGDDVIGLGLKPIFILIKLTRNCANKSKQMDCDSSSFLGVQINSI